MLDDIDKKILMELKKDSRLSTSRIAKLTGIPQTTVHYRIKNLLKEKVISQYTIKVNPEKVGKKVMAYILVLFDTNTMKKEKLTYNDVANAIRNITGVEEFAYTTGQYDIIIKVMTENMKEMSNAVLEKLRKIPGVLRSESIVVMDFFEK